MSRQRILRRWWTRLDMSITLASTWHPRGELARLRRMHPQLGQVYENIVVSLPPVVATQDVEKLKTELGFLVVLNTEWSHVRHFALQKALDTPASHVHYADMDRLIRWVETKPQ